jgi:hypothetical protein
MSKWLTVAFLSLATNLTAADTVNMSGAWRLNVAKSHWGSRPKPVSVSLNIQHSEPELAYTGVIIYSGEEMRPFSFTGAIDGTPYAMARSFGSGTAVLRRTTPASFRSVFRTSDGTSVETTETSITPDRKTLIRRIRLVAPGLTSTSTEIYERAESVR